MACNCGSNPCSQQPTCTCPVKDLRTDCSVYNGPNLGCSGIESGTILTTLIQKLDTFICKKFEEVTFFFNIINIGGGAELYAGDNNLGSKQLRTLVASNDFINIEQLQDEVSIGLDESQLENYIGQNESTYSVSNLPGGQGIYANETNAGNNTNFNFKGLISNSITITDEGDTVRLETSIDLGGTRDFIVNTRYTGDEELGTIAKPYKTLNAAIIDYIGSGTRLEPEFIGSRILCTGGQSHNFTENLSINGLVLEIDSGTTIVYTGTDLYPIDFRTLQTASGGYGTQDRTINIRLRGEGTIISNTLFAYVVNSGHTISGIRYNNNLNIMGLTIRSLYKIADFISGITRSDLSPWVSNSRPSLFYFGDVNEACIVAEGQNDIVDNSNSSTITMTDVIVNCISQQIILVDGARLLKNNCSLTHAYNNGVNSFVIADDTNLVGTVLSEDPLLSYTLPNQKDDLCLIKVQGVGRVDIQEGILSTGYEITLLESWYKVVGNNAVINISDGKNNLVSGGALASNFIETDSFSPQVTIKNTEINKIFPSDATLINTSVNPFITATINNNQFTLGINSNIDLTQNNTKSVVNVFNGKIKESLQVFSSRFQATGLGGLTQGDIFINEETVTAGSFTVGVEYKITSIGSTDFTLIGAASNTVGEYFTATGVGAGTGVATSSYRDIVT